jgi:hypothetical protein
MSPGLILKIILHPGKSFENGNKENKSNTLSKQAGKHQSYSLFERPGRGGTQTGPGGRKLKTLKTIGNVIGGILLIGMLYAFAVIFLCL